MLLFLTDRDSTRRTICLSCIVIGTVILATALAVRIADMPLNWPAFSAGLTAVGVMLLVANAFSKGKGA